MVEYKQGGGCHNYLHRRADICEFNNRLFYNFPYVKIAENLLQVQKATVGRICRWGVLSFLIAS